MTFGPSPGGCPERPNWPEQVRSLEEIEVGELYEIWDANEFVGVMQIAEKPEKDEIGMRVNVVKLVYDRYPEFTKEPVEDTIYLADYSVVPYDDDGKCWNEYNHLKKFPSKSYKKWEKDMN